MEHFLKQNSLLEIGYTEPNAGAGKEEPFCRVKYDHTAVECNENMYCFYLQQSICGAQGQELRFFPSNTENLTSMP